jgi:hypothetical protein
MRFRKRLQATHDSDRQLQRQRAYQSRSPNETCASSLCNAAAAANGELLGRFLVAGQRSLAGTKHERRLQELHEVQWRKPRGLQSVCACQRSSTGVRLRSRGTGRQRVRITGAGCCAGRRCFRRVTYEYRTQDSRRVSCAPDTAGTGVLFGFVAWRRHTRNTASPRKAALRVPRRSCAHRFSRMSLGESGAAGTAFVSIWASFGRSVP